MNYRTIRRITSAALIAAMLLLLSSFNSYAAKSSETAGSAGQSAAQAKDASFELFQDEYRLESYDPDNIYSEEAPYFPYWIVAKSGTISRVWSDNYRILTVELVEEEDDWDYVKLIPIAAGDATVTVVSAEGEQVEVPVHIDQKFVDEYYYMPVFKYAAYVAPVYEGENYICGSISLDAFEDDDMWDMPSLSSMTITASYEGTTYTGTEPDRDGFYTFIGTPVMEWGKEYTVTFQKGEAIYSVTRTVSRPIEQMQFSIGSTVFTGSAVQPKVVIRDGETELQEGTDYSIELSDNIHVGRGKITVYGAGKYSGDKSTTFQIRPAGTVLTDVERSEGGFTVKWESLAPKADAADAAAEETVLDDIDVVDGYVIQYSTAEDFSSGNRSVSVNGADRASAEITGLEEKTVYYVRIRSFKADGDYRYFSSWSEAEKVKTR